MSSATHPAFVKDAWQTPRNARTLRAFMALQNQEIGARIRQLREERGNPPQTVVAEALGVSERTYQTWEYGEAKPSYRSLQKLAGYFGVGEDFILTGTGASTQTPDPFPVSLEERLDRIETFLQQASDERAQMAELLQAQETILQKLTAVADGLPDNQLVRDLSDAARRLQEGAQAGEATRTGRSSSPAASSRRRATDQ